MKRKLHYSFWVFASICFGVGLLSLFVTLVTVAIRNDDGFWTAFQHVAMAVISASMCLAAGLAFMYGIIACIEFLANRLEEYK